MTDEEKADLAVKLCDRGLVPLSVLLHSSEWKSHQKRRLEIAMQLLKPLTELFSDNPPSEDWFRDYYLLTGEHMVLTEEGWIPAKYNTKKHTGYEPAEVLDEVNAK